MDNNEQELLSGLKNGNKKTFEEIYRLYFIPLSYYCVAYVGNMDEAEEIIQNLFLRLWIKRKEIVINSSLKAYLYRSVQNDALNYLNHEKIKEKYFTYKEKVKDNFNDNVQHKLENEELEILIKRALLMLPEKRREIFELSRFEGLKYAEIAKKLSVSIKTVETQMSRALKSLRKMLKDYLSVILLIITLFCY